jgi:hypothetical protein
MARVVGAGDGTELVDRPLIRTLAALPEQWTLLVDRWNSGGSASHIALVLVHAEIGVALIDETSGDASLARATLCRLLQRDRFSRYFPGDLPIVVVNAVAGSPAAVGGQLAAAFDTAPRLSITNPDWAYAIIDLILEAGRRHVAVEQETDEMAVGEPAFRAVGAARISARRAGSGDIRAAGSRNVSRVLAPDRVQLASFVPVWLLAAHGTRAPLRGRRIVATKWAGLAAAILAVTWGFGDLLKHIPPLEPVSAPEDETTAVLSPAVVEPVAFGGEARTKRQAHDGSALFPRSVAVVDPMATIGPSAHPSDAAPRPTAEQAKSGHAKSRLSRVRRTSPSGPTGHATPIARKDAAIYAMIDRPAPAAAPHVECADWLHQNRPGGSDYHGPPIVACSGKR